MLPCLQSVLLLQGCGRYCTFLSIAHPVLPAALLPQVSTAARFTGTDTYFKVQCFGRGQNSTLCLTKYKFAALFHMMNIASIRFCFRMLIKGSNRSLCYACRTKCRVAAFDWLVEYSIEQWSLFCLANKEYSEHVA